MNNMIKTIGEKTKTTNYNPEVVIMTVNKKINSRFFEVGDKGGNNNNSKFVPNLYNPLSGSVITEAMASENRNEFHLVAQLVTQGTCTPTLFRVAY